jgi:hypothetical protein
MSSLNSSTFHFLSCTANFPASRWRCSKIANFTMSTTFILNCVYCELSWSTIKILDWMPPPTDSAIAFQAYDWVSNLSFEVNQIWRHASRFCNAFRIDVNWKYPSYSKPSSSMIKWQYLVSRYVGILLQGYAHDTVVQGPYFYPEIG